MGPLVYHMPPVISNHPWLEGFCMWRQPRWLVFFGVRINRQAHDQNARKSSFRRLKGEGDETAEACLPCKQSLKDHIYHTVVSHQRERLRFHFLESAAEKLLWNKHFVYGRLSCTESICASKWIAGCSQLWNVASEHVGGNKTDEGKLLWQREQSTWRSVNTSRH